MLVVKYEDRVKEVEKGRMRKMELFWGGGLTSIQRVLGTGERNRELEAGLPSP